MSKINDNEFIRFLLNILFSGTTTPDMVDEYDYGFPKLNAEGIYDYPNVDDGNLTERVEITPNPAYKTVTAYMQ